jgi:hypothetical protein
MPTLLDTIASAPLVAAAQLPLVINASLLLPMGASISAHFLLFRERSLRLRILCTSSSDSWAIDL